MGSYTNTAGGGPQGLEGKSAYQVWLDEGNIGTEQDFLNSLVGADSTVPGPKGDTGDAGEGVPIGGTVGQIISKIDGTDYNTGWVDKDTPYDDTAIQAEVDLNTAKVSNVDHPLVETAVPAGAVFTDTVYDDTAIQSEVDLNTAKTGITAQQTADITANNAKVTYDDAAAVSANTAKVGVTTELKPEDIDTLAEINAIITDATLIDTADSRLSDARTPTVHTHVAADVTDFDAEVANNSSVAANTEKTESALQLASSGISEGGLIAINADPTKFDVSAGSGWIVVHTNGAASVVTQVTWSAFTAQTVTNLATSFATDIAININGAIVQQNSFSDTELRSLILIGGVDHSNQTSILNTFPIQRPTQSVASNVAELARAVGDINLSGNNYGPNGANLSIDKTSGLVYSYGRNSGVDSDNPSKLTTASQTALEFGYVFNNGSGFGTFVTPTAFINPDSYDDGTGTLATVANNKFTIQRILFFANANKTFVQYGTEVYNTLTDALDAVPRASFDSLAGIKTAQVRGYIIVKKGATVLNGDTTSFLAADKFGNVAGLEAGSTTATWGNIVGTLSDQTDLQSALDSKVDDAQVLTNVPSGAVFTDTVYNDTAIQAEVDANTAKTGITAQQASDIVTNNAKVTYDDAAAVAANTSKVGVTTELKPTDIDTLAEINAIITDATLIDTGDARLSDARTPTAHTHVAADVTDFDTEVSNNTSVVANTAKVTNVDHPLVETAVPIGAVFTDTVYDDTAIQSEVDLNTAKVGITPTQASDITTNNSKVGVTTELKPTDIDTLAEVNAIITDATLIDTTDSRLSDARTPTAHTHVAADVTDFDTEVSNNTSVVANTAKVGYTEALVSANTDVTANTAKVSFIDAPIDGSEYVRLDAAWKVVTIESVSDEETATSYTLVIGDRNKYKRMNNASPITLTIPTFAAVPFDIDTEIEIEQTGVGVIGIEGAGVTINTFEGFKSNGQFWVMSLKKTGADVWTLIAGVS